MIEKDVRHWRVTGAESRGLNVWFDPDSEYVRIFDIPYSDSDEGKSILSKVAVRDIESYLDKVGSVSADGPGQGPGYVQGEMWVGGPVEDSGPSSLF